MGALAGEEPEGAVGADRDAVGPAVAAPGGPQAGGEAAAFAGGDEQVVAGRGGLGAGEPAARGPGVADAGPERAAAYSKLDLDLAKNASPLAAWDVDNERDFCSARTGCQLYHPVYGMDIAAMCLRK